MKIISIFVFLWVFSVDALACNCAPDDETCNMVDLTCKWNGSPVPTPGSSPAQAATSPSTTQQQPTSALHNGAAPPLPMVKYNPQFMDPCNTAYQTAYNTCMQGGQAAAQGRQAQQAAASQALAAGAAGGPNAAAMGSAIMAGTNFAMAVGVDNQCKNAAGQCMNACNPGIMSDPQNNTTYTTAESYCGQWQKTVSSATTMTGIGDAVQGAMALMAANQTSAGSAVATPAPLPGLPAAPMPGVQEPSNAGFIPQPNPASSPPKFDTPEGGGAPMMAGSTGYTPGAENPNAANNGGTGGLPSVSLGLSGGGTGGGWPTGAPGAAMAKFSDSGFDISQLKDMFQERKPASIEERQITGPMDLTNFQKVSLLMNKKRTVMKAAN